MLQTSAGNPIAPEVEASAVRQSRPVVPNAATPLIPGLLDDDPSAEFQLADGTKHSSGTDASTRSRSLPLKAISDSGSKQLDPAIADGPAKQEFLADGSSPRVRTLPTFSMPNSQNPILSRQQNPGADNSDLKPLGKPGNPRPMGTVSSLQEPGNQTSPMRLPLENRESQEPAYQPLQLPNNRHVLRPIIRVPPRESGDGGSAGQNVPNRPGLGSPLRSETPRSEAPRSEAPGFDASRSEASRSQMSGSNATGTADWEAPMPGVRVRPETRSDNGKTAANSGEANPQRGNRPESMSPNPLFAPPDSSNPSSPPSGTSDPLFALAVQDLYRLPSERRAGDSVSPTTSVTAAGHSISPAPTVRAPLKPRTPHPRPSGRATSDYIWHVIQPNQSLEAISYQYFGDEGGVARLREFNTDVFQYPALLPVGKAIRIPLR